MLCRGVTLGVGLLALRGVLRTGLPMAADFTVRQGGALVLVAIVARLGVTAVAAYSVAYKVMYVATMAFYAVRQAASIRTAQLRGAGREAVLASGAAGLVAAGVLFVAAPWIMAAFGTGPEVARDGVLFLRCAGPYLLLRVTLLGTAVQLAPAYGCVGLGLPGVCLALALAMALQCGVALVLFRRTRAGVQEDAEASWAGAVA